jgi:hypothetical protein
MTNRVAARSLETMTEDEEGVTSLFVKWGSIDQYVTVARDENDEKVYCEVSDQVNGDMFASIRFSYLVNQLILEVTPRKHLFQEKRNIALKSI